MSDASEKLSIYTEDDYYSLPEQVRAELIEGQFYNMAAPSRMHQAVLGELYTAVNIYLKSKKGPCRVYPAPFAVKLSADDKTIVEPDISVICSPDKLTAKGCNGAPDWIIEIVSQGSQSRDYIYKLNLYAAAGVREYWIVNPLKENVAVYCLEESNFSVDIYTFQDKIKAGIYDDLWIDMRSFDF